MLRPGRTLTIERPVGINYEIEEGTLLMINNQLLITREKFTFEKDVISASRFGRYRYKAAITKPTDAFTRCFFDPAADIITDDGSPKTTNPIEGVNNIGSAVLVNLNINAGVPTDNWTVRCADIIDFEILAPVSVVKSTGYNGTVGLSGVYNGTSSGEVQIVVTRRGDLSGVDPRCAQITVSNVIPGGVFSVAGDIPIDIGDGLFITFGTDGEFGDWLFDNDKWLIDIVPSNIDSPVPDIGNTSVVTSVTTGGNYIFGSDEVYTVAVITPGGSGVVTVQITSASGQDDMGPLTVTDSVAIPLGLRGGTITFTGITNLDELDYWTVACSAPETVLTQSTHSTGYSGTVSASGEFTSPLDDTYTIEIVKGGPVGVAEATITSINGDNVETLPIVAGQLLVGSYGLLIQFTDSGELAPGDTWTVECIGEKTEWTVTGDISGEITPKAISGVAYISDDGLIEFHVNPGSIDSIVGDSFSFTTFEAAVPAGIFLTSGTVTTEDMVFLLNSDKNVI